MLLLVLSAPCFQLPLELLQVFMPMSFPGVRARAYLTRVSCPELSCSALPLIVTSQKDEMLCWHSGTRIIAGLREILVIVSCHSDWYQLAWPRG